MINKTDYKGKQLYMGIDVHKATYTCVSRCDGIVVKKIQCQLIRKGSSTT